MRQEHGENETIRIGELFFPHRMDLWLHHKFFDWWKSDKRHVKELLRYRRPQVRFGSIALLASMEPELAYYQALTFNHSWIDQLRFFLKRREKPTPPAKARMKGSLMMVREVKRHVEIYESLKEHGYLLEKGRIVLCKIRCPEGFDTPRPHKIYGTDKTHHPPEGTLQLRGGHHRLPALVATGVETLGPEMRYYGDRRNRIFWLETTDIFIHEGLVTQDEYLEFARFAWPDMEATTIKELVEWIRDTDAPNWTADFTEDYYDSE